MAATLEIIWDFLRDGLKHRIGYYRWAIKFNATIKKHQVFVKKHHQQRWYINASIRG